MFKMVVALLLVPLSAGNVMQLPLRGGAPQQCVCEPAPPQESVPHSWQSKAASVVAGVGAAVRIWKVLPKRWRSGIVDAGVSLVPLGLVAPLIRHQSVMDLLSMLHSIGRLLLFGAINEVS